MIQMYKNNIIDVSSKTIMFAGESAAIDENPWKTNHRGIFSGGASLHKSLGWTIVPNW
jgi:hypothetical protein